MAQAKTLMQTKREKRDVGKKLRSYRSRKVHVRADAGDKDAGSDETKHYDLLIVGCGVGGHGAALHAVERGMTVGMVEASDVGGTCVNRGCVPSKALLAAAGRIREFHDKLHLQQLGISVGDVQYDRRQVASHANNLAGNVRSNLEKSLSALGVDLLHGYARLEGPGKVSYGLPGRVDIGGTATADNIMLATGSTPFVPPGVETDGSTVFTSDEALKLDWVPDWVGIIGSGYIGLEFSDIYTALGSEVTFIEALDRFMPGFDREIARTAERKLVNPRPIEYRLNTLASKVTPGIRRSKPVEVELADAASKEYVDTLELDAVLVATGRQPFARGLNLSSCDVSTDRRGYIPCDEYMRVLDNNGKPVEGLWAIGDVNGKMMLAHAASAQGVSAIECMNGNTKALDHNTVPAATFTHPEISFVGLTEEDARDKAENDGFELKVTKTSFKSNSKALAENESDGMAKVVYNGSTGEILGVHICGLHASDMIHEASNAIAAGQRVQDLKFNVHAHPTLSESLQESLQSAHVDSKGLLDAAATGAADKRSKEIVV